MLPSHRAPRRRPRFVLVAVALAGLAAATCASAEAGAAAFPVTIEHAFGVTEILEEPQRVVSLGFKDQDAILALGVTPVAIRDWFGDKPFATWPWARDELGDAQPEVLAGGELNFEQIAALQPDLIIAITADLAERDYQLLSAIAPTVANTDESSGSP